MSYKPSDAMAYARRQVGFQEVPDGSNCNPYSEWQYGVRCPGGGWCMSFASVCTVAGGFRFEGATHGARGFSFTEAVEAWARPRGLWREKSWRAKAGDWAIFEFGGGYPTDHGELVDTDDGVWMVLIGGNTSNAVKYRTRDRKHVVGFIAFSESDQVAAPPAPTPTPAPPPKPKDENVQTYKDLKDSSADTTRAVRVSENGNIALFGNAILYCLERSKTKAVAPKQTPDGPIILNDFAEGVKYLGSDRWGARNGFVLLGERPNGEVAMRHYSFEPISA